MNANGDDRQRPAAGSDCRQDPAAVILCGACKRLGRCQLGLTHEYLDADGVMHARLHCPEEYEGGPGVAHGGWTTAAFDDVLGHVSLLHGQMAVTATLTVDFLKPVPVGRELEVRAWIERREGSRRYIRGEMRLQSSGALLGSAHGIWVARDDQHFERHRQWLAQQDAQT